MARELPLIPVQPLARRDKISSLFDHSDSDPSLGHRDLRSRHSQTRRRRLINRGLLGGEASEDLPVRTDPNPPESDEGLPVVRDPIESELDDQAFDTEGTLDAVFLAGLDAGLAAVRALLKSKQPVTWVFTGDNVVQGACYTHGARNCVEIFTERIRGELRRPNDVVINTGISGDTAAWLLDSLRRRVTRFAPDVVVISVGINDCKDGPAGRDAFRRNVREILDLVRTASAIPFVILPHPVYLPASAKRSDLPQYVQILREETAQDEVPCLDLWSDWMERWPKASQIHARLSDGRFQLNAASHHYLALLLFQMLDIYDPDSPSCSQPF